MEYIHPNDHSEYHEGDGSATRPDDGLEITDHVSIPIGSTPDKIPPWDHSDSFDDERPIIDTKADTEGNEPVVDGKQDRVRVSPKCYNSYAQLVQLKKPPHNREEAVTGVASSLTPQSHKLLIDTSPWCLPLHTALDLHERILAILVGKTMQYILRVAQKTA